MKQTVPKVNIVLLILAALVNMATLKDEGGDNHGAASDEVEWLSWKNQHRQSLTVTISPRADRLTPLEYDGPIFLQLTLTDVPEGALVLPRWSAQMIAPDGETWTTDGDFSTSVESEDEPGVFEVITQVGRLCEDGETTDDDCMPCIASAGCIINIDVDFCYAVGDRTVEAIVALTDSEGQPFSLTCREGTDSEPCTHLRDWIDATGETLEPGFVRVSNDVRGMSVKHRAWRRSTSPADHWPACTLGHQRPCLKGVLRERMDR